MPFILLKCGAIQVPIPLFLQVDYAFSHQEMYSNSKLRFKRPYRLFVSTLHSLCDALYAYPQYYTRLKLGYVD